MFVCAANRKGPFTFHFSPFTSHFSRKRTAFTLAEVLITLGIIGIVAALTMPTLMTNHEKKVTSVRIKKAYSELSQAIKLAEVHQGDSQTWNFSIDTNIKNNTEKFIEKYLQPYLKMEKCRDNSDKKCGVVIGGNAVNYLLPSGASASIMVYPNDTSEYYNSIIVFIDTNGKQKPNLMGTDAFYFIIKDGSILPMGWHDGITREEIFNGFTTSNGSNFSCKPYTINKDGVENQRHACTALLMMDGWEFKPDYPYKQTSKEEK